MKLKRALATGAAVLITGFSLTACGGDDSGGGDDTGGGGGDAGDVGDVGDAPTDASTEDFCKGFTEMSEKMEATGTSEEQAEAANAVADGLAEVGTPEDAGESERMGFEVWVEFLAEVDSDDIDKLNDTDASDDSAFADALGLDEGEVADVTAFFTYAATACAASEVPTDVPTDTSTELPTGVPTDLQTE